MIEREIALPLITRQLQIDVPVLRAEPNDDGSWTLYLYGHSQPITWYPPAADPPPEDRPAQATGTAAPRKRTPVNQVQKEGEK